MSAHAEEIFECACHHPAHTLRLSLWKDPSGPDAIVTVHLTSRPLLHRAWRALRYLLGRDVPHGHFEEALLRVEDIPRLRHLLDDFEQASREASAPKPA